MKELIDILGLEINARKKEYHPYMRIHYFHDDGLEERWRLSTFVDLIDEDISTLDVWAKKIRTAVLNTTPVCLVSNNLVYLLNTKLLPLADYFVLCYTKYWYENCPVYMVLFNQKSVHSSLRKYGFILSPVKLDVIKP